MAIYAYEWIIGGGEGISSYYSPNTMALYVYEPGIGYSIALLRKPKNLSAEDWQRVCRAIKRNKELVFDERLSFEKEKDNAE